MLRAAAAVAILVAGGGIIASADRPVIRYGSAGNAEECQARQLLHLPQETAVLLMGSSRMRRGVSPDRLAADLGETRPVYNIARPGQSVFRDYIVLRDLYARGIVPDIVVIEASFDMLRGAHDVTGADMEWPWGKDTASVLTFGDHLSMPALASDAGWPGRMALIAEGLSMKITQNAARRLSGQVVDPGPEGAVPPPVCMLPEFDNPGPKDIRRQTARKAEEKARLEAEIGDLATGVDDRFSREDSGAQRLELYALDKIRQLTKAHGTKLFAVRLHSYARPPYSDAVVRQITELIPEALIPPPEVIRATGEGFMDRTHLGPEARALYTDWLARAIRARRAAS